jgi:hypothetical protein
MITIVHTGGTYNVTNAPKANTLLIETTLMLKRSSLLLLIFLSGSAMKDGVYAATSPGACPASVPSGITKCFYADFASGSDGNPGNSETAPLQHFPGMQGCSGSCSAITPSAGEGFILRGGVTWPNSSLGWYWTWSGSSTTSSPGCSGSGCIYIGVDPNWFTGSSWARPILNAGGAAVSPVSSGPANTLFGCYCNYLVFDNIELTGLYWSGVPAYGSSDNIGLAGGMPGHGTNDTFEHLYVHGWSHAASSSGTVENPCGFVGDTGDPNNNANTILEYSVISGADTTQDSCSLVFGSPPYIAYNVLEYGSSAMVIDSPISVHDNIVQNVVTSFDTSAHENALEENYSGNTTVYNNIFRHIGSGSLTLWLAPDSGSTAYVFNNVIYDTDTGNVLDFAASLKTSPSGSIVFWNNTVECGQDSNPNAVCAGGINSQISAVTLQNNHFITNAASYWATNGVTPTQVSNLFQTKSAAASQGYTSSEAYAFSPTAAYPTDSTPGKGTSAAALCAASGVSACNNDTAYGVIYNTANHTVASPGRQSLAWKSPPDIGAYSFGPALGNPTSLTGSPIKVNP